MLKLFQQFQDFGLCSAKEPSSAQDVVLRTVFNFTSTNRKIIERPFYFGYFWLKKRKNGEICLFLVGKKSLQFPQSLLILKIDGGEKWGLWVNQCQTFPIRTQKAGKGGGACGETDGQIQ
nr:hypothetical protein [uncultured Oscillibacter sp.]